MLAIIIPYYKLTFFEATLQSLAHQTDKRFKVYIGDDASSESPLHLLDKFKDKFDFVYHRFEANLGGTSLTQQWDRCIALSANEKWIMILGDDDVLGENVVEEFQKNSQNFVNNVNIIRFTNQLINEISRKISNPTINPMWETSSKSFLRKVRNKTRSSLSEYVFSKSSYLKFKFTDYPLGWHSDDKAWLDFSGGQLIYSINNAFVYVRLSTENISGQKINFELKNRASLLFLKDILNNNKRLLLQNDLIAIMLSYEVLVKKSRKLLTSEWFYLLKMYMLNLEFLPLLKLLRRCFISFLK